VLGVRPILGRSFRPEEEAPGGQSGVVVLTHSLWSRRFGADPSVIGRRIALRRRQDASSYQIVGVLPPGVTYPITALRPVELFLPYVATAAERDHASRGRSYGLHVVGRLGPGVTLEQARSDVDRVNAAVRAAYYSQSAIAARYVVLSLHDRVVGPAKSWLLLVLAAVTCVLLVGCVNAASLLLARATVRTRELATRAAVGASRARLARTLLAEGLVLALIASAAATLLAFWGLAFTKAHLPEDLTRTGAIALDTRVLIASIGAAVLCGLFAGGVPAWRVMRSALVEQMRVGGAIIGGRRQERSLAAFLMAEVAFVTVLLVATTLAVASFVLVTTADLGFDRRNVMAIEVSKSLQGVPDDDRRAAAAAFFADVLDRARAVPGVTAAGLVGGFAPLSGSSIRYSIVIPGIGELEGEDMFETREVSPEYFPAMGLRILRGRSFAASDGAGAPAVAIINDLAARRYFPGREPLGELVIFRDRPTRIVGVVQNVRLHGPEADWHTEIYIPLAQSPQIPRVAFAELVVRTAGNAAGTGPAVREAIRPALAGQVAEPRFVDEAFHRLTSARRFNAGLMTLFGLLAVVIGGIGIYGTMAFVVAQQTRAIGLRMALGASQTNVLRSVLGESLWRVGLGTTLGMICAWSVSSLFSALVFGIQTTSPTVYAGVALGLGILGLLAALVPARRAARLDPLAALRAE
jgi:predicted permease